MQAAGRAAKRAAGVAVEMLEMQDDLLEVIGIAGEIMQGLGRTTLVIDRVANLGRQAFDVLRVVAIFASQAAALRERLSAGQRYENKCSEIPPSHKGDHGVVL